MGTCSGVGITVLQNDGKIVIGYVDFNSFYHFARLNADGTLDATFNPGKGANGFIWTTALQNDGKIIIGGGFMSYNGTTKNYIARLNSDGTLDATFNSGTGTKGTVRTLALQSDGKIIIGGGFSFYNEIARNNIARLNADGTLDTAFNSGMGANDFIWTTVLQNDGKIIIGGDFSSYNGIGRNKIACLNADGSLDATFNPGTGINGTVKTTALQSDGKIIIGGGFTSYNGTTRNGIARLNSDGTLDATFNPGTGASGAPYIMTTVSTIVLQSDGKIIIGGTFRSYNGTTRKGIARLNTVGTLDTTFDIGTGVNTDVSTAILQSDGKIIIGGNFTAYNGTGRNRIARILNSITNGVSFLQSKAISIYPNPVSNELHIEIEGNNEQVKVEILNSIGQVVFNGNIVEKTTVQTSNFASGFYLIKLGNDKAFELKKIIKK